MPHCILILNNVGKSDVKKLLLDKVLSACKTQVPTVKDLHRLVHACHGDPDYISQLQQTVAGRTWLDSVPVEHEEFQDLLKTLEHFLGPFASTEILIPTIGSCLCREAYEVASERSEFESSQGALWAKDQARFCWVCFFLAKLSIKWFANIFCPYLQPP